MGKIGLCGVELNDFEELLFIGKLETDNEYVITNRERSLFVKAVHEAYQWGKKIDEENDIRKAWG